MIQEAYQIAKENLRNSYSDKGVLAGTTHFSDYWARDGLYAVFGMCELGDFEKIKKELLLLLNYQKKDGQLPLRVGQKSMILNFLGIKGKIQARYTEDKKDNVPTDQNSLFIIALKHYVDKTGDIDFVKKNHSKIKKVIDWYGAGDLVVEDEYCSWADNIRKKGKVLYTNVLYCKALSDMHKMENKLGHKSEYMKKSVFIKEKINKEFWSGNYYSDWIDSEGRHDYFTACGNLLAIIFDVADKEKAYKILYFMEKNKLDGGFTTLNAFPRYKKEEKSALLRFFGMDDYQDNVYWLWPGCLDIIARHKTGFKYEDLVRKMSEKIVEHKGVYEVYSLDGKPLKRLFYRSEKNFAWSSSLFIHAVHETKLF